MRGWRKPLLPLAAVSAAAWWLAQTPALQESDLPGHAPDLANGELLFHAGGCASCHGSPAGESLDGNRLGGGLPLDSPVGRFHVPNISPHPQDGIGRWTPLEFVNAMQRGLAPDGSHYYPSFPYSSYARMTVADLLDLRAYLATLPAVTGRQPDHDLLWPYGFRWALGWWKRLYLDADPVIAVPADDARLVRGRYLVEGPGHCGECHTPRNFAWALDTRRWLAGAPLMEGKGKASKLSPTKDGLAKWSESDVAYYLETGVDPEFDVVGGPMVAVQENLARLSADDRAAIAAYLKALPAVSRDAD